VLASESGADSSAQALQHFSLHVMSNVEAGSAQGSAAKSVTLSLPSDIITALDRLSKKSGQPQSHLLIAALRRGLGLSRSAPAEVTQAAFQQLADRLAALETLPQRVEQLEAQLNRGQQNQFVTEDTSQRQPQTARSQSMPMPVALPLNHTLIPDLAEDQTATPLLETCPKCDRKLGAPLKTSGRLVCGKCGWTDKPRLVSGAVNAGVELPPDELRQLLEQATTEALTNMKPKSKQNPEPPTGKRFPLFDR